MMFSGYFNFNPTVEESGSFYIIKGIEPKLFSLDLKNYFGTSVMSTRMINRINSRTFKIHKFFAVELIWILDIFVNERDSKTYRGYRVGLNKYTALYKELKEKTWVSSTFNTYKPYDLTPITKKFSFTPFDTQKEFLLNYAGIKQGFQLKGCLLDAKAGSGKSFLSLAWSEMLSPYKTIILVPKKLVNVPWVDHIDPNGKRYCFKNPPKYWTSLDKTNPLDHQDAEYFIFYSENIRKDNWQGIKMDVIINTLSKNGKEPLKLIIDECHNYNDLKSQQTQGLIELGSHKYISDVLFMSGTPIKALGKETYPMFVVLDKYFDRYVRDDFLKMYGRDNYYLNMMLAHRLGRLKYTIKSIDGMGDAPVPVTKKVKFPGVENFTLKAIRAEMLKYIQERIVYYNKMMPEYIYDFNKYIEQYRGRNIDDRVTIENLDKYIKIVERFRKQGYSTFTDNEYSKFCKEVEVDIESYLKGKDLSYFRHIKTAVKYVGLKIRGEALGNVLGRARIEAVKATIEHCGLDELINGVKKKTAIYSAYVDALDYTDDYLKANGWDTIKLTGDNSSEIDNMIKLLETDPKKNPLITTFKMLSEGYPLLMCNQIIVLNSPWRSYQLEQTIHRIFRKGQDSECFVWLIDLDTGTEDNVTSRNIDIMEWSAHVVDQLLNGSSINNINGVSLKVNVVNDKLEELLPFDIFNLNYRPKFTNRTILDLIR